MAFNLEKRPLWMVGDEALRARLAQASKEGTKQIYNDPLDLWAHAMKYFEWADNNPVESSQVIAFQGSGNDHKTEHPRAHTIQAMCTYMGITSQSFRNLEKDTRFAAVCEQIQNIMFTQKFDYAMVGVFNASLAARALDLADKRELSGPGGGAVPVGINITPVVSGTFLSPDDNKDGVLIDHEASSDDDDNGVSDDPEYALLEAGQPAAWTPPERP